MEYALTEIKRIIKTVIENSNWRSKEYFKAELEKIIEEMDLN